MAKFWGSMGGGYLWERLGEWEDDTNQLFPLRRIFH